LINSLLTVAVKLAERDIIDWLQESKGRPLTKEEINLSLMQARQALGPDLEADW
jgi:hypothetical protein